jgi:hypothetical protein
LSGKEQLAPRGRDPASKNRLISVKPYDGARRARVIPREAARTARPCNDSRSHLGWLSLAGKAKSTGATKRRYLGDPEIKV